MSSQIWIVGESPNKDAQSIEKAFPRDCASRRRAQGFGISDEVFEKAKRVNIAPTPDKNAMAFSARRGSAYTLWRDVGSSRARLMLIFGEKARKAFAAALYRSFQQHQHYEHKNGKSGLTVRLWFLPHPSPRNSKINPSAYPLAARDAAALLPKTPKRY